MAVRPRLRPPLPRTVRGLRLAGIVPLVAVTMALAATAARAEADPHAGNGSTTPTLGQALEPSTAEQRALSEHLRRVGAVFYGAWWCPACFKQKNLFGQEAGNRLPYVECDKGEPGRERCRAAAIKAYPTWVLNGRRLEGVQSLRELKDWSGFPAGETSGAIR
ncbi:MAG: hypothetical protein ACK55E_08800 [Cyanobacteriota bacterium]|jgi:hypothetical protein